MGHVQQRLIAFDLDGTLVDSRRDLADAANDLLVERGGAPLPEDAIGRMVGEGAAVLVRRALTAAGLSETSGDVQRFLEIYDTRLLNHTRPYDGVIDAARFAARHARVVVLTNKPRPASERILEGLGVRDVFAEIVGGDGPYPRKPDPSSLLSLMAQADARVQTTLLVGDSAIDHETAIRAGVQCCLAAYGFGYLNFPQERLTGAEWVVRDTSQLRAAIERFVSGST